MRRGLPLVVVVLLLALAGTAGVGRAADGPQVRLSAGQAGAGGAVTVSGSGWRPRTLLMVLVCGRATPARGVVGGTNSCANGDGRAVTTDADGAFSRKLPVAEPPVPCPCVVHVATVTGATAEADAVLEVAGHPVAPLPAERSAGRLAVLSDARLTGSSGLLTWFGAPAARTLVLTVGNTGTSPIRDPVFQVGTAHGVFAPEWDERQWHGTLAPGKKARITLPVELSAGAHGDYTVTLRYGGRVLAEQPWGVGRPWGVTLFWVLLCLVVPAALFRAGMAVVDRVRPRRPGGARHRPARRPRPSLRLPSPPRLPLPRIRTAGPRSAAAPTAPAAPTATTAPAARPAAPTPTLPWFAPDSAPGGPAGRSSAPHDDSPTSPTTPTTKGPT
ncbi:hypothetical protein [Streptomyces cinerochromogenes]|uniref:hypothetical protein n=1 Tax=Streptomyces cinerochromogenes TaxID=66422 RepID=UPI0019963E46|nr:hypothetical protein [Streptomyces cinerochromogenes]GGS48871.1 hypothetical protein GCM10010206_07990 [Streptomyces cinerochromogenes]